jgi:hypothetical protein
MRLWMMTLALLVTIGQSAEATPIVFTDVPVPGNIMWSDTGIDVSIGELLSMSATGLTYACLPLGSGCPMPPDGWAPGIPRAQSLAPSLVAYSLVGRIGVGGTPFFVGSSHAATATEGGRLYMTMNDEASGFGDNSGTWLVSGSVALVPEPSTFLLTGLGVLILAVRSAGRRGPG